MHVVELGTLLPLPLRGIVGGDVSPSAAIASVRLRCHAPQLRERALREHLMHRRDDAMRELYSFACSDD